MINFKKGTGHSLLQTDTVGLAVAGQAIEAGHGVRVTQSGGVLSVYKGASASPVPAAELIGFAINDQTDGDVIASGKIGVILKDGNTVIETDKAAAVISYTNYPIGTPVTIDTSGNVTTTVSSGQTIGVVEGIRTLPDSSVGASIGATVTVLGVKLGA